jgi:CheY-like chemotaxis protein
MPKSLGSRHVLVVEDELLVALDVLQILEQAGCTTVLASNVASALSLIAETTIDGAVLDINLGPENSFPVADVLAANRIPFVFVSGYAPERLPDQYRKCPFVRKPFLPLELTGTLDREIKSNW